ncbi:DUF72 domain-containing protein [Telluria antibiotica]|uniref:DUF72 domain-containing protein n=1 Tax=Telluria antibiotica TaxID=2717319 RepID=UPI0035316DBE
MFYPPGFVFAVKGNRFLTHMLKLRGIETPLANVLASGVFALREKLGPILWQFPPQLRFDADRVERFLSLLPHDTGQALAIALLRKHGVALVIADTAGKWPDIDAVTADFVYVRLHGEHELYASGYEDASLERRAARVRAPFDAKRLIELVGTKA